MYTLEMYVLISCKTKHLTGQIVRDYRSCARRDVKFFSPGATSCRLKAVVFAPNDEDGALASLSSLFHSLFLSRAHFRVARYDRISCDKFRRIARGPAKRLSLKKLCSFAHAPYISVSRYTSIVVSTPEKLRERAARTHTFIAHIYDVRLIIINRRDLLV